MDRAYLEERIVKTKAMIEAYEDAITNLSSGGGVESYTLDDGQSRQTVKRSDVTMLQDVLDTLYARLDTFCARLNGSGVSIGRPAW